ncbi:MAG: 50S ribosomal protein L21 [bacterium]|nr:50S ribosomal protein L21 [bacterium]
MSQTFAIIKTGGKQYKVAEGQKLRVEKLNVEEGSEVVFDSVLMVSSDADLKIGTPMVEGAKVSAKVAKQGRDRKIIVFKYKAKKRYKKKAGHRQAFTDLEITKISA